MNKENMAILDMPELYWKGERLVFPKAIGDLICEEKNVKRLRLAMAKATLENKYAYISETVSEIVWEKLSKAT